MTRAAQDRAGATYDAAVRAWADHLRDGGTTPWDPRRWSLVAVPGTVPPAPSATHLELLRRLNLAGLGPAPAGLADVLLTTPRPGRGPVDPPLPWPQRRPFGSPPVDPADLDVEPLLRLAVGVVVRLLPDVSAPARVPPHRRRAWPWRTGFRLHGTRLATATVREGLLAAGAVEGGRRPVHLVLGLPLEQAMAEHWSGRVGRGDTLTWPSLWRRASAHERLPPPVDVDRLAGRLVAEHPGRVHAVLAADHAGLVSEACRVLGLTAGPTPRPSPLRLPRWELQRRVTLLSVLARGQVTGVPLVRRLRPVLDELDRAAPPGGDLPAAPPRCVVWATRAGADLAARVDRAGYPVHGDPGVLARPTPRTGRPRPGLIDPSETLDLALAACLRLWWRTQEGTLTPDPTREPSGPTRAPSRPEAAR